ncbi:glycosyltransferase family 2 protein [Pontibacter kalidii]|uniref:glycosyltransferase family 2 protein n=1 Tax=Pontibacter kalidii TaxID=2592049 RepID=UPI00224CE5A7|nr:glycosyltransferase family A protein [Pontibacter kalidii]
MKPKVSIITCFYNEQRYLEEAIESVLHQTYTAWQLLLIDDGSSDNSTRIARRYAAAYPLSITYCAHEGHINKGLSASRNLGLRQAQGELIAFLDADDVWQPTYLEAQLNLMQQAQVSILCEATVYWYDWNLPEKENQVVYIGTEQDRIYHPPQLMLTLYPLGKGAAPCMCGIILKKEILLRIGGFEDTFRGMYEDQVFLSKLYLTEPVYISSGHLNLYRQRPDSLVGSSQHTPSYHLVRKQYLQWLKQYLQHKRFGYKEVEALLQQAMQPYTTSPLQFITYRMRGRLKRLLKKYTPSRFVRILK